MSRGLFNLATVAAFLGVQPRDVVRMVMEDGLPCLVLPGRTRPVRKFSGLALHGWLAERAEGKPLGVTDFLREMEAVRSGVGGGDVADDRAGRPYQSTQAEGRN